MGNLLSGFGLKVFELILPTLATALAGLGVAFLSKKLQSLGITVDQQQQQQLKDLAAHAVLAVEEQARRQSMSAGAKNDAAVAIVKDKLPNATTADVNIAIDAALPKARAIPSTPATFGRTMPIPPGVRPL